MRTLFLFFGRKRLGTASPQLTRLALLASALMMLVGCGDDTQMMTLNDMSFTPLDDLAVMQCMGTAGTCQGAPCGAGCKCRVDATIAPTDAGDVPGPNVGTCVCSPVVEFDGPTLCCGGVACLMNSSAMPTCNGSDCSAP
jgi:hypothetical protein